MVATIINLSIIMGEQVRSSLEAPLSNLAKGATVMFHRRGIGRNSSQITINHEQAAHHPSYDISWITEDGQFMILTPMSIDPDANEGPDIRTLVKRTAHNACEIVSTDEVVEAAAIARREIEDKVSLGVAALQEYQSALIAKYL